MVSSFQHYRKCTKRALVGGGQTTSAMFHEIAVIKPFDNLRILKSAKWRILLNMKSADITERIIFNPR